MSFQPNNPYIQKSISKYASAQKNDSNLRKGIAMYAQLISSLELAKKAIEDEQIDARTQHIKAAENTIMKLKSCLDFESKDEVVFIFDKLYTSIIGSLHEIVIFNKPVEQLVDIIEEIRTLKNEFEKIDQEEAKLHKIEDSKRLEC
jgi:flagellar biosynthetic protein FliS